MNNWRDALGGYVRYKRTLVLVRVYVPSFEQNKFELKRMHIFYGRIKDTFMRNKHSKRVLTADYNKK